MTIRSVIVDDEPLARRAVRRGLLRHPDIEILGECGDGESAVQAIRALRPNLVFLDIQMPEMDGFQVLRRVGARHMPVTIFVTAHDRFAIRAFETNAIDYLLKPYARHRFDRALERARERIAARGDQPGADRTAESLASLAATERHAERLAIPENGRIVFVPTRDIDWIEADGNNVRLHLGSRIRMFRETLTRLEARLDPTQFLRIHRSTIVNVRRIREIEPWVRGYHRVVLEGGTELRMSRYQLGVARALGVVK
ncbi:MAG TPA: LytTR family DNA-binding domain-containing protein [Gemmatimonadales bacterium]|nr:LytTR family DNA-binding domain-containing protein [Gemmatimonadales bacterium]